VTGPQRSEQRTPQKQSSPGRLSPFKGGQPASRSKQPKTSGGGANPYPYNRHSEVCSAHGGSHLKNTTSPVTKPRMSPPRKLITLDTPAYRPASRPTKDAPVRLQRPSETHKLEDDQPRWPSDGDENAALLEFENFLQQSGQNSANASFAHFDSFSQKKPAQKDALDEALRESEQLSSYLEGSVRAPRLPRDRENIFKV
jgi:hypothetical protein